MSYSDEEYEELVNEYNSINHAFGLASEKLEAINKLMRKHPRIMVNQNNQYSIMPMNPSDGDKFAKAIMAILYPDDPSCSDTLTEGEK